MTYIVSGGTLNPTHSLTHCLWMGKQSQYITNTKKGQCSLPSLREKGKSGTGLTGWAYGKARSLILGGRWSHMAGDAPQLWDGFPMKSYTNELLTIKQYIVIYLIIHRASGPCSTRVQQHTRARLESLFVGTQIHTQYSDSALWLGSNCTIVFQLFSECSISRQALSNFY